MVVSQIARFLGIVGILIASLAQVILLFKVIDLKESIWGNLVGVGLIGIPVLFLTLINLKNTGLPTSFNWLGIVLGVAMVMGIFAGIFFLDEMHAVQNFTLQWSGVNPMIYPLVIFGMITQLFFPIWLLWTAQLILSGRLTI